MSERWKPEHGETYYYTDSIGAVDDYKWTDDPADRLYYESGNCFKTEEEAEAAAEKVKALLLSLHGEPPTTSSQLPKLTVEVFDRPDCPEWAEFAAVDYYGNAFFFEGKPFNDAGRWYQKKGLCNPVYFGCFDKTNWFDSLIERSAKLPDWCKVGEWAYHNERYGKITGICHTSAKIDIAERGHLQHHPRLGDAALLCPSVKQETNN